jgi:subtilase family serine protease
VAAGVNWLVSVQNADGSWSEGVRRHLDTYEALEIFLCMDKHDSTTDSAVEWVKSLGDNNVNDLARETLLLSLAGEDMSSAVSSLLGMQNAQSVWGSDGDFEANNLDTALALLALNQIDYSNLDAIGYAFGYVIDNQKADGGFGFYSGDDSNVYMTALLIKVFSLYSETFDFQDEINAAAAFILTKQNLDGGFGSSPSTVFETALAASTLIEAGQGRAQPLRNAINFLQTAQQPNGSWNDDPYSTALALQALYVATNGGLPVITGMVSGKVVDAAMGQPLVGVTLIVQNHPEINTLTDASGNFTLTDIPEGSQTIEITLPGYVTTLAAEDISAGSVKNLGTIPLSPALTTGILRGVVTDADTGQPLGGVTITVAGAFNSNTDTDRAGGFVFTGVTPGSITITAENIGYYTASGTGTVVAGGTLSFDPQMSTQPPAATTGNLTGVISDGFSSLPLQGAIIEITSGQSANSDAQGGFMISDMATGQYQVTISASGYVSQLYQVVIMEGVTTDLQNVYLTPVLQSSTISGTVTDMQTGAPIFDADVTIIGTGISTTTNAAGSYTLSGITLLEFDVKTSASGYESLQFHGSSSDFSLFEVYFGLSPIQLSDLQIVAITANPLSPTQGDLVTIDTTIFNAGYSSASNVLVRIYEGDPDNGGVQIGSEQIISSIESGSPVVVSVNYDTVDKPGRRQIFVQADPLNTIKETDETNNKAKGMLTVTVPPDFYIDSSEITYAPVNPTVETAITITSRVRNLGEKEVSNVPVNLYNGDPAGEGVLIGSYSVPALSGNGSSSAVFMINNPVSGLNSFYIVADPSNSISEMIEMNNMGNIAVNVSGISTTDLSIYPSDIKVVLSPGASQGDVFTIYANIKNTGSADIQTEAAFYDDNPDSGGVLLGKTSVIAPAFGTYTVAANLFLPGGAPVIYVVVDPGNRVAETVETNNIAFIEIGDSNLPDFVITENQVRCSPSSPTTKSQVIIEADIYNYGGAGGYAYAVLYEGDPDNGGVLKGALQYPVIGGNYIDSHNFKTPKITLNYLTAGEHVFYVVVDPYNTVNEVNETNNKEKVTITVTNDAKVDLSITDKNIAFMPEYPLEGELVSVKANIYNAGSEPVLSSVSFYNGDPHSGGTRIYQGYFNLGQEDITRVSSPNFYMTSDVPEIFVLIDEDNLVTELNDNNNTAFRTIDTYRDDLSISISDISLNPMMPEDGDTISVDVTVHSSGQTSRTATLKLYEGDPEDGQLIHSTDFAAVGNQLVPVSFPSYTYPGKVVLTAVIENISPLDVDQSNNSATATYGEWIDGGTSNEGTDFWLAWPTRVNTSSIIIQSKYNSGFTVALPGPNGIYREVSGTVSPGVPAQITLSGADAQYAKIGFYSDVAEDKGIHITSDKDVSVLFHVPLYSLITDETYLALPTHLLGTEYYLMAYTPVLRSEPAEYTVIAIEDNTNIKIGSNFVNLNRGQIYYHFSPVDLTGTHVKSDKPIGLIASTVTSDVPERVPRVCCADPMLEQMLPVSLLGTDYFVAPLHSPDSGEIYRLLAAEDNTVITVNHMGYLETLHLNSGEWTELVYEHAMHITSNSPVMVMQYPQGMAVAKIGDPSQITIIPTDKLKQDYRFYTHAGYEHGDFITVVAPEPDTIILLDGVLIDNARLPLPDKGDYMIIPIGVGEHEINADKPVAVYAYGYRDYGSYGYPAGFALSIANLSTDINASPSSATEGQLAGITATVSNDGNKWAEHVIVRAFHGDPMNGGVQIGDDTVFDIIYPKETRVITFTWETYGNTGTNNIYIAADPDNAVEEFSESDNTAMAVVEVTEAMKPDPSVTDADLLLSQQVAGEGETVTLTAVIKNRGSDTGNIPVSLHLGDPDNGGILLQDRLIPQIIALNGETALDFSFSTLGFQDSNALFIVIDRDNMIDELTETNNKATVQLQVERGKIALNLSTGATQYDANSDLAITVYLKNENILPFAGSGEVSITDRSGNQVAQVETFKIADLSPMGLEGWHYRAPMTVAAQSDMEDAIAAVQVDFSLLFAVLGLTDKTLDLNSIRVVEFDSGGDFIGEKNGGFDKGSDFDIVTNLSGSIYWLMDGMTPASSLRYFYLYFDSVDNGVKPPQVNRELPLKGKRIAFSGRWGDIYTVIVNDDGTFGSPVLADQLSLCLLGGFGFDDFNNDGYPDIVTGDMLGDIYYHENAADGSDTFLPKLMIGNINPLNTSNNVLQSVTSADYNNDGKRDFTLNSTQSDLYVFYGNGDGSFLKETVSYNPDRYVTGKASVDLNNDGYVDVVAGDNRGVISILFNNKGQGFDEPTEFESIYNGNVYGLDTGDLDGDGYVDILFSMINGDTYIMNGIAQDLFEPAEQVSSFVAGNRPSYEIYDVNGDGINDVMAAQYYPSEVYCFDGNGDGSFKAPVNIPSDTYYATSIEVSKTRAEQDIAANIDTPEKIENQIYQVTWNTGDTLVGDYLIDATVYDINSNPVAKQSTPISIVSSEGIVANLALDKMSYHPTESVEIVATVNNGSVNSIYEDIRATVTIEDLGGQTIFTENSAIGMLTPSSYYSHKSYWNTATYPSGDYPVTLEIMDASDNVLSAITKSVTISSVIDPSTHLIGQISVDNQSFLQSEPVNILYSVTNIGNSNMSQVDLSVLTLHSVDLTTYDTLTDQADLLMGETYNNIQQLDTQSYSAKDYLVVLRASISGGEETLASTYFRVEGAPSAPSLYLPPHGEDIEALAPALSVNNASDPNDDGLTYEFELYEDETLNTLVQASGPVAEETNMTEWEVPADLQENAWYFWRGRAYDGLLYGEWMPPASFRVNVQNDPPTAPTLTSPSNNAEVDTFTPILTVNNASDPDSVNLTYNFELALDMDFSPIMASETGIFQGQGATSWEVPVNLSENTSYYWRAQADDWLDSGPWMAPAVFFVNTANDAPTAPIVETPADGSEAASLSMDVIIANSTDPESDPLTYTFELDSVNTFDSSSLVSAAGIPEGAGATTWNVAGLTDNTWYYVRARASDGTAESLWSTVKGFFVNTVNDPPAVPVLNNPSDGSGVNLFLPELSVMNSTDIDGDLLTYEFEGYNDPDMISMVAASGLIPEMTQVTSWVVPVSLIENNTYYWRARSCDEDICSSWMPLSSFMVNTANDAPMASLLHLPAEGSSVDVLNPLLSFYNATDPDSDNLTYDVEIYIDGSPVHLITGIAEDNSGITAVPLSDALTDNATYSWRARAYDGDRYGPWMDMAMFSVHLPVLNITATIDFDPDTLNQKSKGEWVVVYIELPNGHDVHDIDISSLMLEHDIPAELRPVNVGDHDKDGIPDLMVKFKRSDVISLLSAGEAVPVTVTGTVGDVEFEGVDTIGVIH